MASVLICEDDAVHREFLEEALTDAGHEVVACADALAAQHALAARAFAVLLTDLRMPGEFDGHALVQFAREHQPEVEIIVLTAFGNVELAVDAMRRGVYDFIVKPVESPAEIRRIVGEAARQHHMRARAELVNAGASDERPPLSYGAEAMKPCLRAIERVAPTEATVLLLGESGTGKELAARQIHALSRRANGPFVAINCATLSENLLASDLFGHEKGAFTGAQQRRRGRIEAAAGGSFFLDEVGELELPLQAKLLRLLQERSFERVGGHQSIDADVRWIAATNRNLEQMVAEGRFREDLYHRIAVFPIGIPPLRDRHEDIAPLSDTLLAQASRRHGCGPRKLSAAARALLEKQRWPGNVRELGHVLERAAILADGPEIQQSELCAPSIEGFGQPGIFAGAAPATPEQTAPESLADMEANAIRRALDHHQGNRTEAARSLGIGVRTLFDKIKKYAIEC